MASFECLPHSINVPDTFKSVVEATVIFVYQDRLERLARTFIVLWVLKVGNAKLASNLFLFRIQINPYNTRRARKLRSMNHCKSYGSQPPDRNRSSLFHFTSVSHRSDASGNTASQQTHFIQRRIRTNFGDRVLRHDGILCKCAASHVMVDLGSVARKARRAVGHGSLPLCSAHCLAQIGLFREAEFALAAFGGVQRNNGVANFQVAVWIQPWTE
mmetsp:Transcript_15659/g.27461  ORF Transcript_15659/g.27461 Transcript_15659/m.27461 type:complete len:215 (-) Transcript_15659:297-941(-)